MSPMDRAATRAGAALDRVALRVMERVMTRSGPRRPPKDARDRLDALAAHYRRVGDDLFPAPPEPLVRTRARRTRLDCEAIDLEYPSRYAASIATYRAELAAYTANAVAHARLYTGGPGRPVIIAIHGWGGGQPWLEERAFQVARFLRSGTDVALFQLPFHARRAPSRSGQLFPSPHVVRTNEAFAQAIWDLRQLAIYLRERGATSISVMGMSLGGYTTALWAGLDASLEAAIPIIPAVSMADLMWRHGTSSDLQKRARAAGVDRELLASAFAVHAPLSREPAIERRRLMIVAGRGDQITPADQAEALWRHWQEPTLHWFAGGHLAQVGRRRAFSEVRRFLREL